MTRPNIDPDANRRVGETYYNHATGEWRRMTAAGPVTIDSPILNEGTRAQRVEPATRVIL